MCSTCAQLGDEVFFCSFCTHWVAVTAEAHRHHEDTEHPQLVMSTLRAQLKLAQDLQRSTQEIVVRLSDLLTVSQEHLEQHQKEN